jgi:RNA methyltransferase, TrmH family
LSPRTSASKRLGGPGMVAAEHVEHQRGIRHRPRERAQACEAVECLAVGPGGDAPTLGLGAHDAKRIQRRLGSLDVGEGLLHQLGRCGAAVGQRRHAPEQVGRRSGAGHGVAKNERRDARGARATHTLNSVSAAPPSLDTPAIVRRFHEARRDGDLVVLQGFHALKHALRFGAHVEMVVSVDRGELERLSGGLAPDLAERIEALAVGLPTEAFKRLGPYVPHTGVVSVARRAMTDPLALLGAEGDAPIVLLEDPRHFGNLGAVIRVAAAVEAAGVLPPGRQDPPGPVAVGGSAGLHFALPVARVESVLDTDRPLLALDPSGEDLRPESVPPRALLAFGTERAGLSDELLERADARLRLPMREGVSSLNLATSVAAVLYSLRLSG